MLIVQQLQDLETLVRDRISKVLDSDNETLRDFQEDLRNFNGYSTVSFSSYNGKLYLDYTYRDFSDNELNFKSVALPDLFVEDFEKFMKN